MCRKLISLPNTNFSSSAYVVSSVFTQSAVNLIYSSTYYKSITFFV